MEGCMENPRRRLTALAVLLWLLAPALALAEGNGTTAAPPPRDEILDIAIALHYKALCDAAIPGYQARVAGDYATWRAAKKGSIAQLETSPDFQKQQAVAKVNFEQAKSAAVQSGEDEVKQLTEAVHRTSEVDLVNQFRFGTPLLEASPTHIEPAAVVAAPITAITTTTVHRHAGRQASGAGMVPQPPPQP